jgi:photosystem II stability/assembly factor-like uncharacterized protein
VILRSNDGGRNWLPQNSGTTEVLWSVVFSDADNGIIVGEEGTILRTSDGGAFWSKVDGIPDNHLTDVCYVDANTLCAVGRSSRILRSTDGGETWKSVATRSNGYLASLDFVDAFRGLAVGGYGEVLASSDGGASWSERSIGANPWLRNVEMIMDNGFPIAFTCGDRGIIYRSDDGGETWTPQVIGESNSIFSTCFTDARTGTAVGSNGTILRTTTGGVTWVEDEKPSPSLLHLGQNYPNPVSASTTIPFSLTSPEHVRLSVYDMLGREVAVLVNGRLDAGLHSVRFDAAGLPSGMYFSVLKNGAAVETRKLLLTNTSAGY